MPRPSQREASISKATRWRDEVEEPGALSWAHFFRFGFNRALCGTLGDASGPERDEVEEPGALNWGPWVSFSLILL